MAHLAVIILVLLLVILCYLTPLTTIDTFANLMDFGDNCDGNGSEIYSKWNDGSGGGYSGNGGGSGEPCDNKVGNFHDYQGVNLIKPDGIPLGGYMSQIVRPPNPVTTSESSMYQKWCSEKTAVDYYGMRPLIGADAYNKNLQKMFNGMIDKRGPFNNANRGPPTDQYEAVFCQTSQKDMMQWIMGKVALQVSKMPEMQRNGPLKEERFFETDVLMYQFINPDSSVYYKIVFNLYNPSRSISTLVYVVVYIVSGTASLVDMGFVNEMISPDNEGYEPFGGYNVSGDILQPELMGFENTPEGEKSWIQYKRENPDEFDWNYQNTLPVQKFNTDGYYSNDPVKNIEIEGGLPDSLKQIIRERSCEEANLMPCMTPGFTGITAPSASALNNNNESIKDHFAKLNGEVKNVSLNPTLYYSNEGTNTMRQIETVKGMVYI